MDGTIKMVATKDFPPDTMEGAIKEGDSFRVTDERAFVLSRLELAERAADQSHDEPAQAKVGSGVEASLEQ